MSNIKVTPDVWERIMSAAQQPMTLQQIADVAGVSASAVSRALVRAGVERPKLDRPGKISDERVLELTQRGLSNRVIAEAMGCSTRAVERSRERLGIATPAAPQLTGAELARVEELLSEGASVAEAARTIGRSRTAIQRKFPGQSWSRSQCAEYGALQRRYGGVL